jgi:hypothetical protein
VRSQILKIQPVSSDKSIGSLHMPQSQVCVSAEQFSIASLERKMMFLNEPQVQMFSGKSNKGDVIKHLW